MPCSACAPFPAPPEVTVWTITAHAQLCPRFLAVAPQGGMWSGTRFWTKWELQQLRIAQTRMTRRVVRWFPRGTDTWPECARRTEAQARNLWQAAGIPSWDDVVEVGWPCRPLDGTRTAALGGSCFAGAQRMVDAHSALLPRNRKWRPSGAAAPRPQIPGASPLGCTPAASNGYAAGGGLGMLDSGSWCLGDIGAGIRASGPAPPNRH